MRATLEREVFSQHLCETLGRVGDDGSRPTRLARELSFSEGGKPVLSLREPATAGLDYDLAREVVALSQAHQGVVRTLVRALRKSESATQ